MTDTRSRDPVDVSSAVQFLMALHFINWLGFAGWNALLHNYTIEAVGFGWFEAGLTQTVREIPGFLAFTVAFWLMIVREQVLGYVALVLLAAYAGLVVTAIGWAKREAPTRNFQRIAELAIQPGPNRRLVLALQIKPVERVEDFQKSVEWSCFLLDAVEECLRFNDLRDISIGDALQLLHGRGLSHCLLHWLVDQKLTAPLG